MGTQRLRRLLGRGFPGGLSGKSEIGPPWLLDGMVRMGPGDYLVASPTFPLMLKKVPIFLRLFDRLMHLVSRQSSIDG